MASAIPSAFRSADVARFAHRGGQLEKAKPVVAYYCYYWIVDQVMAKQLHNTDHESLTYTTNLMDKLEQMKADHAENDAITDDVAGQAYVEQFAIETFQRAENVMKANKVTRQTADTFQAAATFLELGQIWTPLDAETISKIKFAKYHALRIAKAIRAGEDPNSSNPVTEPEPLDIQPLDPNDPEVQMINGTSASTNSARQPSVEDAPEGPDPIQSRYAQENIHGEPSKSIRQQEHSGPVSPSSQTENFYTNAAPPDVSPLAPPSTERKSSLGGGYFPSVPEDEHGRSSAPGVSPIDGVALPVLPDAHRPVFSSAPDIPPASPATVPGPINPLASLDARPATNNIAAHHTAFPDAKSNLPQLHTHAPSPYQPSAPTIPQGRQLNTAPVQQPAPFVPIAKTNLDEANFRSDEEAIVAAQKHARWAISALNFEDVNTAVKELRGALESLGAG